MKTKEKFIKYEELLRKWSDEMNLVAPSTLNDIQGRHIEDSLQLSDYLPKDIKVIDLGSGAGFPAIVLAVMGWDVTAVESIGKKTRFLNAVKQELGLENFSIFHGRVEDFIKQNKDDNLVFTARAFASLDKIFRYVYRVKNCRLFLLKGRAVESEIQDAKKSFNFKYRLFPSKTGDGFIIEVENLKLFHMK